MTAPDHVFDELPGLLAGELDRSTTGRVAAHLRTCDDCRHELVLVVSAGAALRSAVRFAPQAVLESDELPDPSGFLAELAAERSAAGAQLRPVPEPRTPEAQPRHAGPSSRRRWWTAVAAAVLLLAGLGAGVLLSRDHGGQRIVLQPTDPWTATATATLRGDQMDIKPANLPQPGAGHYYEVWLVNQTGQTPRVLSVGVLTPSGASLTVPPSLASGYDTVVVTDEIDNGDPRPSKHSVMSGQYHP